MTKMAARPIYGKNLKKKKKKKKKKSPEPKSRWPWNLVRSIGCPSTTKFVQRMTLCWPLPVLRQGQIWSRMLFIMQSHKIFASQRGRINMTFICVTKLKHISTDQIKTAFWFSLNATWSNALTTSIKECYLKSSGAMLKQRHVNKQQDDFSSVLQ